MIWVNKLRVKIDVAFAVLTSLNVRVSNIDGTSRIRKINLVWTVIPKDGVYYLRGRWFRAIYPPTAICSRILKNDVVCDNGGICVITIYPPAISSRISPNGIVRYFRRRWFTLYPPAIFTIASLNDIVCDSGRIWECAIYPPAMSIRRIPPNGVVLDGGRRYLPALYPAAVTSIIPFNSVVLDSGGRWVNAIYPRELYCSL